mgnify:FL=1
MTSTRLRNRLRLWRASTGLTLDEVADLTGLSKAYLSRLERGERHATPRTKVQIARRLGVAISAIFDVEPLEEVSA